MVELMIAAVPVLLIAPPISLSLPLRTELTTVRFPEFWIPPPLLLRITQSATVTVPALEIPPLVPSSTVKPETVAVTPVFT